MTRERFIIKEQKKDGRSAIEQRSTLAATDRNTFVHISDVNASIWTDVTSVCQLKAVSLWLATPIFICIPTVLGSNKHLQSYFRHNRDCCWSFNGLHAWHVHCFVHHFIITFIWWPLTLPCGWGRPCCLPVQRHLLWPLWCHSDYQLTPRCPWLMTV